MLAAFLGPQTSKEKLREFCAKINPGGPGWKKVIREAEMDNAPVVPEHPAQNIALGVIAAVLSCFSVYAILIGTGDFIYGRFNNALICTVIALITMIGVIITWKKMNRKVN